MQVRDYHLYNLSDIQLNRGKMVRCDSKRHSAYFTAFYAHVQEKNILGFLRYGGFNQCCYVLIIYIAQLKDVLCDV